MLEALAEPWREALLLGWDAYAAGRLVSSEDHLAHPVVVEGPLEDDLARLGELLHVAHFLWRVPDSNVARFYRRTRRDLVQAAAALPPPRSGASLEDVLAGSEWRAGSDPGGLTLQERP